jgi:hypothetical protein
LKVKLAFCFFILKISNVKYTKRPRGERQRFSHNVTLSYKTNNHNLLFPPRSPRRPPRTPIFNAPWISVRILLYSPFFELYIWLLEFHPFVLLIRIPIMMPPPTRRTNHLKHKITVLLLLQLPLPRLLRHILVLPRRLLDRSLIFPLRIRQLLTYWTWSLPASKIRTVLVFLGHLVGAGDGVAGRWTEEVVVFCVDVGF